MFKLLIASGVAVSAAVLASPAQADGWYLNPELNAGWSGSGDFTGSFSKGHVGYDFEKVVLHPRRSCLCTA